MQPKKKPTPKIDKNISNTPVKTKSKKTSTGKQDNFFYDKPKLIKYDM